MIRLEKVYKIYESKAGPVPALKGISFEVKSGEFVTIMGPSGSGKTTTLNLIGGIDRPSAGKVLVAGKDLPSLSDKELEEFRLNSIGYVFQEYNLIPGLTAIENVELPMIIKGIGKVERRKRALKLLEEMGLKGKEDKFPEELSGGEKQRVSIAVAMANDPPIIIADEPTGELDIETGEKVMKLLRKVNLEGKTVLITTHDPRVARMTNRIILLEDGRIKGEYMPKRIGEREIEKDLGEEEILRRFMEARIEEINREIKDIFDELKEGTIELEEFISRYNRLKSLKEAYIEELNKLGIIKRASRNVSGEDKGRESNKKVPERLVL